MKKTFVIFSLLLMSTVGFSQTNKTENKLNQLKKVGVVAELSYIKTVGENKIVGLLSDNTISDSLKINVLNEYQELLADYNATLIQLIMSIDIKGSIVPYSKIENGRKNNHEIKNKQFNEISKMIDNLESELKALQAIKVVHIAGKSNFVPADITGPLKDVYDILNGIYTNRKNKADGIISLLKDLQMRSASELLNPKEKESK